MFNRAVRKYFLHPFAILLLGVLIAYISFAHDAFRIGALSNRVFCALKPQAVSCVSKQDWVKFFNIDSEILTLGKIVSDKFNMPIIGNQAFFSFNYHGKKGADIYGEEFQKDFPRNMNAIYNDLLQNHKLESMPPAQAKKQIMMWRAPKQISSTSKIHSGYTSQYGLQAKIYSYLFNRVGITNIDIFHVINALLMAIIVVGLSVLFTKAIDRPFGIIFYLSMAFSPWVIMFAKHLYWVTWAMYLPAVFGLLYYLDKYHRWRGYVWLGCVFLAFLFRSLVSYEFVSTIILFAAAIFFVDMFKVKSRYSVKESLMGFMTICGLGVLAFMVALYIHASANWNGHGVIENLINIYHNHVVRQSYEENMGGKFITHLADALKSYSKGDAILVLLPISIGVLLYNFKNQNKYRWERLAMVFIFLATGLSWVVLAKNHSAIHTHLISILKYFGTTTVLIYVVYKTLDDRGIVKRISRHYGGEK